MIHSGIMGSTTWKANMTLHIQLKENQNHRIEIDEVLDSSMAKPVMVGLNHVEMIISRILIVFSAFWANLFRLLVFKMIKKQGLFQMPINTMILVEELGTLIGSNLWFILSFVFVDMERQG